MYHFLPFRLNVSCGIYAKTTGINSSTYFQHRFFLALIVTQFIIVCMIMLLVSA